MKHIAQAIVAVGFIALGFWGIEHDLIGSGWLVAIGVIAALGLL